MNIDSNFKLSLEQVRRNEWFWPYLYFQNDPSDGALYDVGSVKTIHTVHAKDAPLITDHAVRIDPTIQQLQCIYKVKKVT